MSIPRNFKRITLHLARNKEHPVGWHGEGYDIVAPLDADQRIDVEEWRKHREFCRVRRFRAGEGDQIGYLRHRAGGAGGATWIVDYDPARSDDDEPAYRLGDHRMQIGEYLSIRDEDEELRTYQIVAVENAA